MSIFQNAQKGTPYNGSDGENISATEAIIDDGLVFASSGTWPLRRALECS